MHARTRIITATFLALSLVIVAPAAVFATTVNDSTGSTNSGHVNDFGPNASRTYGQTIHVPTSRDTVLTHFAFMMRGDQNVVFRGELYAWDAVKFGLTGPALYISEPTSIASGSATPDTNGFSKVDFATGGVNLAAGGVYIIFATVLDQTQPAGAGALQWAYPADDNDSVTQFVHCDQFTEADLQSQPCLPYQGNDANYLTRFETPLVLGSIAPTSGPVAGGTRVVITGSGFLGVQRVVFGSTAATSFTIDSDTQLTVIAPALAAGQNAIKIIGSGFSSAPTANAAYTSTASVVVATPRPTLAATGVQTVFAALTAGLALLIAGSIFVLTSRRRHRALNHR